jgi:hypothetical protein
MGTEERNMLFVQETFKPTTLKTTYACQYKS